MGRWAVLAGLGNPERGNKSCPGGVSAAIISRRRWAGVALGMALVLAGLALAHPFWFPWLGRALVARDVLEPADVVVVLQGSIPDRIVKGAELYQRGWGERILMVEAHDFADYRLVEEYGLELKGNSRANRDAALQLGVPSEDVLMLPGRVQSTWGEARALRAYFREQRVESIILVTSLYHSRRAEMTFERLLNGEVQVISRPTPYDPFEPDRWWQDRRQALNLLLEYQKLLNLLLFQRE